MINLGDTIMPYDTKEWTDIKIHRDVHKLLKEYCQKHGIKLYAVVEQSILDKIQLKKMPAIRK